MRIAMAADHGGFEMKDRLIADLRAEGHEVDDFGARRLDPGDDYPDFVIPMAEAVASGRFDRGVALCGSGVGACIAANKVPGARAALVTEGFSARQGVEDDDMNIICLGARVLDYGRALDLTRTFLEARFSGLERHARRLGKIAVRESATGNVPY